MMNTTKKRLAEIASLQKLSNNYDRYFMLKNHFSWFLWAYKKKNWSTISILKLRH